MRPDDDDGIFLNPDLAGIIGGALDVIAVGIGGAEPNRPGAAGDVHFAALWLHDHTSAWLEHHSRGV